MASVPLKCSICPKKPKFSDISHLLTHVSSKGHLSQYHKLQVRSHQEPAAIGELAAYDNWYQQHGLGQLLSERMITKEAKKENGQTRNRKSSSSTKREGKSAAVPTQHSTTTRTNPQGVLDPLLSRYPAHGGYYPRHALAELSTNSVVNQQMPSSLPTDWPTLPNQIYMSVQFEQDQSRDSESDSEADDESFRETLPGPFYPKTRPASLDSQASQHTSSLSSDHSVMEPKAEDTIDIDDDLVIKAPGEHAKLKGVLWPGMDIFDSATEQMRRKRNQKKDGTILRDMERTSEIIEPTEKIFSPGGTMRKQRRISGLVEDSSPLKGETPIPKKRQKAKRPATNEASGHAPQPKSRTRRHGETGKNSHGRQTALEELSRHTLPYLDASPAAGSLDPISRFSPTERENAEFRLTFGGLNKNKKKGAFKIFNDDDGVHPTHELKPTVFRREAMPAPLMLPPGYGYQGFGQPHALSMLTSQSLPQHHQGQRTNAPRSTSVLIHGASPSTNFPDGDPGKENIEPIMGRTGRIDPHGPGSEWGNQRYFSLEGVHLPRYYNSPNPSMEFGAFASSDLFGYSSNPLTFTFQQLHNTHGTSSIAIHDSRMNSGTPNFKASRAGRPKSSDDTISDTSAKDGDEFARFYFDELAD